MKKINKAKSIALFTVLALGTIYIADYSESGAKYYKDVETGLTYRMGLAKLSNHDLGTLEPRKDLSEPDKLYLSYSVPRNLIMTDEDTTDKYKIVVNKGCEIKKVNGANITAGTESYTFTYSDKNVKNISVEYICPVEKVEVSDTSDFMNLTVSVYEQMTTDVKEFLYTKNEDVLFKKSDVLPRPIVGDYHQLIILDSDSETAINRSVDEWLTNNRKKYAEANANYPWANSTVTNAILNQYLKKGYTSDIKQFNDSLIEGITFSHVDNQYIYTLDDSFIAYALTDYYYNSAVNERTFYFSDITKTDAELQNLFEYYVDKYLYKNGTQQYTDIIAHVNNYGGISSVIKGTSAAGIPGIRYYKEGRLELQENLLDYVYPPVDKKITLNLIDTTGTTARINAIKAGLQTNYSNLVNDKMLGYLISDYTILSMVSKRDNVAFNDYVVYNFEGINTLVNYKSAGDGIIEIEAFEFDSNIEIDLSNISSLSVAIDYVEGQTNIMVSSFDNILNVIDSKYSTNLSGIITSDMIDNYTSQGNGLIINKNKAVIQGFIINAIDEFNKGALVSTIIVDDTNSSITNGAPEVSITDDPDKVVSGDTPDDEIPIFDDLVTTEPGMETTDTVVGENQTETETPEKQEDEEQEEDKTPETDDNSKKAETDIEKEFVDDIEEVEKLIEDMKEFVGDTKEVSDEEEAIAEVDALIETVKDYVNEA